MSLTMNNLSGISCTALLKKWTMVLIDVLSSSVYVLASPIIVVASATHNLQFYMILLIHTPIVLDGGYNHYIIMKHSIII